MHGNEFIGIEGLLPLLEGVRKKSATQWVAKSPVRRDKTPSLSIKLKDDGSILMHDFGGGDFFRILDAIGLKPINLMPPHLRETRTEPNRKRSTRSRLPQPRELRDLQHMSARILVCASMMRNGEFIPDEDMDSLVEAHERIDEIVNKILGPVEVRL